MDIISIYRRLCRLLGGYGFGERNFNLEVISGVSERMGGEVVCGAKVMDWVGCGEVVVVGRVVGCGGVMALG